MANGRDEDQWCEKQEEGDEGAVDDVDGVELSVGHCRVGPLPHVRNEIGHDVAECVERSQHQIHQETAKHCEDSLDGMATNSGIFKHSAHYTASWMEQEFAAG